MQFHHARDDERRAPVSPSLAVLRWFGHAPSDLALGANPRLETPIPLHGDPADLVARAFAVLEEETAAWQQRRHANLLPGSGR